MRVHLLSQWALNPYQKLLGQYLRARGLEVFEQAPARVAFRGAMAGDVVHLQNVRQFLTAAGTIRSLVRCASVGMHLVMSRLRGVRIVWTAHDLGHLSGRHPRLDRAMTFLLSRTAHAVIVHSAAAAAALGSAGSRPGIHVVPHGSYAGHYADTISREAARARLGLREGDLAFLFFGWVRRYKGVLELVRTFRSIPAAGSRLLIAGAAPDVGYGRDIETAAAGDPRILLHLGAVPDDDVQVYMNASDAVVFPYDRVLTSGAIALAKSFGKACIVAGHGGLTGDVGSDGAFFYDPAHPLALRDALEGAATRIDQLREMGVRNREAARRWTWDHVADATLEVYRSIGSVPEGRSRSAP
jgi:beta-1,4-mannosyltransferase